MRGNVCTCQTSSRNFRTGRVCMAYLYYLFYVYQKKSVKYPWYMSDIPPPPLSMMTFTIRDND